MITENGTLSTYPSFELGFRDSINPCNFTTVLIFIILMSLYAFSARRIFFFGIVFIAAALCVQYISAIGAFDYHYTNPKVLSAIQWTYLFLAGALITLGIMHILDWWEYKKHADIGRFRLSIPCFLKKFPEKRKQKRLKQVIKLVGLTVCTLGIAVCASFLDTSYPQSEYIFIVHSFMLSGGNPEFVRASFFLYSATRVLILFLAWLVIWFVCIKNRRSTQAIVYFKGILSALLISTGIGLGYYFLL